ncbi:Kdo hydroxylase family protein [Methylovirgula sp. 4M-Z18]|uniref:Kdo hydroxylase family protein n=1 Tax=Methylovirgula sp. 4M-Z18 TaxID=2293567 RepID=UPI000E2FB8A2|nr:Kdo hydroxylase family protein [Methylovirgula sp. 4M-Z18]RFB79989.1 3-deoxy-D-manno-oct-2-ulosonic acid (Kdo) hydroxylase [Methylovirgula sp. 4M-Z18]
MSSIEQIELTEWSGPFTADSSARAIAALEEGKVLFFPHLVFPLLDGERALLSPDVANQNRKNITLDPRSGQTHGVSEGEEIGQLVQGLLSRYGAAAKALVSGLFPQYVPALEQARTTFRPIEIEGREYKPRQDDRRLHVDAFPTRPTGGRRILRVFSNIAPAKGRVWRVGEPFENFAKTYAPKLRNPNAAAAWLLHRVGITKAQRSGYDQLMLQLHDLAKLDDAYQASAPQERVEFPPNTAWMCFTDQVLHAALAGQFALEQTFHMPVDVMARPQTAPIKVLERITARALH